MLKKRLIIVALSSIALITHANTLHFTIELPKNDLALLINAINQRIGDVATIARMAPPNFAALSLIYFSSRQLFINSPAKERDKRHLFTDWILPCAGLSIGTTILYFCNKK